MERMKMGMVGCGDFLRWQEGSLKASTRVAVKSLFDTDRNRAQQYADKLGGQVVDSADAIIGDPSIDIVCLFVPPWVRRDLVVKAAAAGKHILTTKPLGPTVKDCAAMVMAVEDKRIRCGVIYRRTGNAFVETCRQAFADGGIGKLALYKQDWLHHYPSWNTWALDPKKNGGPFMDAMIHNLNIARYLMGRKPTRCTYFSDSHAHHLTCSDTDFMKLDFEGNGSAHLFITWAADLAVYSTTGNDREHIDICYMITDEGWRVTEERVDGAAKLVASKDGKKKTWDFVSLPTTPFDAFAEAVSTSGPQPADLPTVREAFDDIKLVKDAEAHLGQSFAVKL